MKKLLLIALASVLAFTSGVGAEVVTLCQTDTQAGPGTNLATAIAAGGRVTFACGRATVRFTRTHTLVADTEIDGGGIVTLDGDSHAMLSGPHGGMLRLVAISVTRGRGVVRGSLGVVLDRVTITQSGDAVSLFDGAVDARESRFEDNEGTVLASSRVTVRRSVFRGNRGAPIKGGLDILIEDSEFTANDASVFEQCRLSIRRSKFAAHRSGALRIGCDAEIVATDFSNNNAPSGGAIWIGSKATRVALRKTRFMGNTADAGGGAIAIDPVGPDLVLSLQYASFKDNRAARGGAINLQDHFGRERTLEARAVLFAHNTATEDGGAIYGNDVKLNISRGIFVDNRAKGYGGAIVAGPRRADSVVLANCLLVRNHAPAGSAWAGRGARFVNTTIAANEGVALAPRFLANRFDVGRANVVLVNTIISSNAGGNCGPASDDVRYAFDGHSLQFPGVSCGDSVPESDPRLDNMFVPAINSPAYGGGDLAICMGSPVFGRDVYDQRRPRLDSCSIGAVEGDMEQRWMRYRKNREQRYDYLLR